MRLCIRSSTSIFLLLLPTLLVPNSVFAHEVRPAYLQIRETGFADGGPVYHVLWKQPIAKNRRLPIDPVFPEGCDLSDRSLPDVTAGALIHRWLVKCDLSRGSIHISGLSGTLTDVMVSIVKLDGETTHHILRPENPTLDLAGTAGPVFGYLLIGIEHLVFGFDHVLFVLGLFLLIKSPVMLLKTITAFTVAHSITLALSVLGWVMLQQGPIEAIIALSIVFLARELVQENIRGSRLTHGAPWAMAFVFGLLHGLGFAGALANVGLPQDALWASLLFFNLGIEIGQIAVIALMAAAVWLLARVRLDVQFTRYSAWGMGALAAFWTIDRALLFV